MTPTISVCVPTFNAGKYLRACLDSILSQTFIDFELLIVDNHSSDQTHTIIEEYAEFDPRIRIVRNEHNIGAVGNFNRCLELAQGKWIKFVFADDFIAPSCLEKMLAASKPDSALVCCRRDFLFEPGIQEETKKYYLKHLSEWSIENLFSSSTDISANDFCKVILDYFQHNIVGEPTAVMLHRNTFYRFGTFNTHIIGIADIEYWTRVAIHTGLIYVPYTLATSRVHGESVTSKIVANKHYRKTKLDRLILLHDFVFHPNYAPLRVAASHRQPPFNFKVSLAEKAYEARRIAIQSISSSPNQVSLVMNEWQNVIRHYPELLTYSNQSLFKKASNYTMRKLKKVRGKMRAFLKKKVES
ncbi:MAG: glycosyltransferase family 2 protein [Cyanobacteria bacterium P01_D01_bin.44]